MARAGIADPLPDAPGCRLISLTPPRIYVD